MKLKNKLKEDLLEKCKIKVDKKNLTKNRRKKIITVAEIKTKKTINVAYSAVFKDQEISLYASVATKMTKTQVV